MKNARETYAALLRLYPRRYRNAFGAEMMQTFLDLYRDVQPLEGRARRVFWFLTIIDELSNIAAQHKMALLDENPFLRPTSAKVVTGGVFVLPLFFVFYASLVKIALFVPHPPVSGIGALLAFGGLLLLSGTLSVMTAYLLASAMARVFQPRNAPIG